MTDAESLERCRRGDQRAWAHLVTTYERLVYSIPLNLGLDADDAADVTQATFGVLLGSMHTITEPERLPAWLSTVARRQSIRVIEARQRDRRRANEVAAQTDETVDEDAVRAVADDVEWVHQGLTMLNGRCRALLTELFLAPPVELPPGTTVYEAAASRLGMPVGSVGPTRKRCLDALRAALDKLGRERG